MKWAQVKLSDKELDELADEVVKVLEDKKPKEKEEKDVSKNKPKPKPKDDKGKDDPKGKPKGKKKAGFWDGVVAAQNGTASSFTQLIRDAANNTGRGPGKDRDLMRDTGGKEKHRTTPEGKPTRDENKRRYSPRKIPKDDRLDLTVDTSRDKDISGDPDLKLSGLPMTWRMEVPFSGVLTVDRTGKGWGFLEIDDSLRESVLKGLGLDDVWLDPDNPAHISVFNSDELVDLPNPLPEEGDVFTFTVQGISSVAPETWEGVDEVVMITVDAPELAALRASYDLTPLLYGNHRFHITVAIRKEAG